MKKYAFPIGMGAGVAIGWLLGLATKQVAFGVIFGFFLGLGLIPVVLAWGEKGQAKPAPARALVGDPAREDPGPPIARPIAGAISRDSHHYEAPTRYRQTTVFDDDDRYERDRAYDIGVAAGAAAMADELAREQAEADYAASQAYVEPDPVYVEPEPEPVYVEPEPTYSESEPDWSSSDDSSSSDSSGSDSGSSD